MLQTGTPLFYRVTVEYCRIDLASVRQRAGLALMLGGGGAGIALSGVMGGHAEPVVVLATGTTNLCMACSHRSGAALAVISRALEDREDG